MPTMDSVCIQTQAEQPIWLPEAIDPFMLQENWLELLLGDVLLAAPLAITESIAPSIDEHVREQWASSEDEDFLDEVLCPSNAALPVLEGSANDYSEIPSSLLELDDARQPSLEEMLGLRGEEDDTSQFHESFEMFIHSDGGTLQSSPEEKLEALLEKMDIGGGGGDDEVIFVEERSPSLAEESSSASPPILKTGVDFESESSDEVLIRSRKRKRPSSAEQSRPSGDGNGDDEVIFLGEDSQEWLSVKKARQSLSSDQQRHSSRTKKPGGMF
jgi:hypothetical protein